MAAWRQAGDCAGNGGPDGEVLRLGFLFSGPSSCRCGLGVWGLPTWTGVIFRPSSACQLLDLCGLRSCHRYKPCWIYQYQNIRVSSFDLHRCVSSLIYGDFGAVIDAHPVRFTDTRTDGFHLSTFSTGGIYRSWVSLMSQLLHFPKSCEAVNGVYLSTSTRSAIFFGLFSGR